VPPSAALLRFASAPAPAPAVEPRLEAMVEIFVKGPTFDEF
jgi:hypothetical protein